jgi:O-antigen/teichoic acid export membrane protein
MGSATKKSGWSSRVLMGAFTNWLSFAATLLVGFFLTPYLVRCLGAGPYGLWIFVESILAYFTLFDMGIAAGVVRFVARYHASDDREELNRLVSTCLALFLGLGLGAFAIGGAFVPWIAGTLEVDGMTSTEVVLFSILMLANLAITLPLSIFPSILDGLQRFATKSFIRILSLAIRTVGTILLMEREPNLLHLAYLFTVCNLLEHLALAWLAFRHLPGMKFSKSAVNRETMHLVKNYSLAAFIAMIAGRVTVQSGLLIVGSMLGAIPLTFFAIAWRLVEFAKALLRTATNTLTPAISSLEAKGETESIRQVFLFGSRWVLYLMLPVQLGLIFFGRPFLTTWMGSDEFARESYPSLIILASTLSLVMAQSIASRVLYGMAKLNRFARATVIEAVVNVGLSLALGWKWGMIGVALGMAIPNLFMNLWVIGYTVYFLNISVSKYLVEVWLRPVVLGGMLAVIWTLENMPVLGWGPLALGLSVGLIPYGVVVLILERPKGLMERIQQRWPKRLSPSKYRTVAASTMSEA